LAPKLDIPSADLLPFGHDKAKVSESFIKSLAKKEDGRLNLGNLRLTQHRLVRAKPQQPLVLVTA
jgi:hypothetical protein